MNEKNLTREILNEMILTAWATDYEFEWGLICTLNWPLKALRIRWRFIISLKLFFYTSLTHNNLSGAKLN